MNWNDRYVEGDLPWETGREDFNLVEAVSRFDISPCSALELGCGTGNNAIWLAKHGFSVTAVDVSEAAIVSAKKKAQERDCDIAFSCQDILAGDYNDGPFSFVFDRGCFHSFSEQSDRIKLAAGVHSRMSSGATWLSIIGSKDGPDREVGPPRLSAEDVVRSLEKLFEIISLSSTEFDSDMESRPRAWSCLMRKREV